MIEPETNLIKTKQVILIRKDLKMRRGKEIAQGSHASMEFLIYGLVTRGREKVEISMDDATRHWITNGKPKVCLRVNSEEELLGIHNEALKAGLKSFLIRDSGRTEFGGVPTLTACAIGPNASNAIDQITGTLTPY